MLSLVRALVDVRNQAVSPMNWEGGRMPLGRHFSLGTRVLMAYETTIIDLVS